MAVCQVCNQEMTSNVGCTMELVQKADDWRERCLAQEDCTDCGAPMNTPHHPGCDQEVCPECGGQFAYCDCYPATLILGSAK